MDISGLVRRRRRFGNHSNLTADAVPQRIGRKRRRRVTEVATTKTIGAFHS